MNYLFVWTCQKFSLFGRKGWGKMNTQFYLLLLAVLMLAVGGFWGLKIIGLYRRKTASMSWPSTTGTILSRGISSIRNSQTKSYSYRAEITYRYSAPGGPFEKKLFLGSKGVQKQAEKLIEAVGDTIQVRYNPEKTSEHITALERIMPAQVLTIIGCLILAAALILLAFI